MMLESADNYFYAFMKYRHNYRSYYLNIWKEHTKGEEWGEQWGWLVLSCLLTVFFFCCDFKTTNTVVENGRLLCDVRNTEDEQ